MSEIVRFWEDTPLINEGDLSNVQRIIIGDVLSEVGGQPIKSTTLQSLSYWMQEAILQDVERTFNQMQTTVGCLSFKELNAEAVANKNTLTWDASSQMWLYQYVSDVAKGTITAIVPKGRMVCHSTPGKKDEYYLLGDNGTLQPLNNSGNAKTHNVEGSQFYFVANTPNPKITCRDGNGEVCMLGVQITQGEQGLTNITITATTHFSGTITIE